MLILKCTGRLRSFRTYATQGFRSKWSSTEMYGRFKNFDNHSNTKFRSKYSIIKICPVLRNGHQLCGHPLRRSGPHDLPRSINANFRTCLYLSTVNLCQAVHNFCYGTAVGRLVIADRC